MIDELKFPLVKFADGNLEQDLENELANMPDESQAPAQAPAVVPEAPAELPYEISEMLQNFMRIDESLKKLNGLIQSIKDMSDGKPEEGDFQTVDDAAKYLLDLAIFIAVNNTSADNVIRWLREFYPYDPKNAEIVEVIISDSDKLTRYEFWSNRSEDELKAAADVAKTVSYRISAILLDYNQHDLDLKALKLNAVDWKDLEHSSDNSLSLAGVLLRLDVIKDGLITNIGEAGTMNRYGMSDIRAIRAAHYIPREIRESIDKIEKVYFEKLKKASSEVEEEFAPKMLPHIRETVDSSNFGKFSEKTAKYIFGQGIEKEIAENAKEMMIDVIYTDLSNSSSMFAYLRQALLEELMELPLDNLYPEDKYTQFLKDAKARYKEVLEREMDQNIEELVRKYPSDMLHASTHAVQYNSTKMQKVSEKTYDFFQSEVLEDRGAEDVKVEEVADNYFELKDGLVEAKRQRIFSTISGFRAIDGFKLRSVAGMFKSLAEGNPKDLKEIKDLEKALGEVLEKETPEEDKGDVKKIITDIIIEKKERVEEQARRVEHLDLNAIGNYAERLTQGEARKAALDLEYNCPSPDIAMNVFQTLIPPRKAQDGSVNYKLFGQNVPVKEARESYIAQFREHGLTSDSYRILETDSDAEKKRKTKLLVDDINALFNHSNGNTRGRDEKQLAWLYNAFLTKVENVPSDAKLEIADELYELFHSHVFKRGYHDKGFNEDPDVTEYTEKLITNPNLSKITKVNLVKEVFELHREISTLKSQRNIMEYSSDEDGDFNRYRDDDSYIGDKWKYTGLEGSDLQKEMFENVNIVDGLEFIKPTDEVRKKIKELYSRQAEIESILEEKVIEAKKQKEIEERDSWGFNATIAKLKETGVIGERHEKAIDYIYDIIESGAKIPLDEESLSLTQEQLRYAQVAIGALSQYAGVTKYIESAEEKMTEVTQTPNWEVPDKNFRFRVLQDKDPQHFSIGAETDCCQILGGEGEDAAIDSFINGTAGVIVVEFKDEKGRWHLATQSYFHYVPESKSYILDNIEHNEQIAAHARDMTGLSIEELYALWAQEMKTKVPELQYVGVGKSYTKINLDGFSKLELEEDPREFHEDVDDPYSDFDFDDSVNLLIPYDPEGDFQKLEEYVDNDEDIDDDDDALNNYATSKMKMREALRNLKHSFSAKENTVPGSTNYLGFQNRGVDVEKNHTNHMKSILISFANMRGTDVKGWDKKPLSWIEKKIFGKRQALKKSLSKLDWHFFKNFIRTARWEMKIRKKG